MQPCFHFLFGFLLFLVVLNQLSVDLADDCRHLLLQLVGILPAVCVRRVDEE
jgi:hypothetical protein